MTVSVRSTAWADPLTRARSIGRRGTFSSVATSGTRPHINPDKRGRSCVSHSSTWRAQLVGKR
jgi:hypothetical protein